jgi:pimeloyl-ACP methyl ester carboxylesterase
MTEAIDIRVGELVFSGLAAGPRQGELVILLHGFPQTARAWRAQLAALSEAGLHAVAPDMRGFSDGARPEGVEQYALEIAVSDVVAIAAELGSERFHLAGHDLGGIVAWELACRHPARVKTLTVASTPHLAAFSAALRAKQEGVRIPPFELFRQPGVAEQLLLADDASVLRQAYAGLSAEAIEDYVTVFTAPEVLTATLAYFRAFDFEEWLELPASTAATLFVWGSEDPFLDPATAAATRENVSGSYVEAPLEGVGHWLPELAPDAVSELLLRHISSSS